MKQLHNIHNSRATPEADIVLQRLFELAVVLLQAWTPAWQSAA